MKPRLHIVAGLTAALMALVVSSGAHAKAVYAGVGLFGAQIGCARAVLPCLTVSGDCMTLCGCRQNFNESAAEDPSHLDGCHKTAFLSQTTFGVSYRY